MHEARPGLQIWLKFQVGREGCEGEQDFKVLSVRLCANAADSHSIVVLSFTVIINHSLSLLY